MKIFNWVQRKFSNNKENAANNKNNGGTISVIGDHDHQLWSGGILTIGTFGYDPLIDIHEENDRFHHEEVVDHYDQMNIANDIGCDEEDEEEVDRNYEDEEEKPFVFAAYDEHESEEGNNNNNINNREFEYEMMEKKERITLADLFIADHADSKEKPLINNNNNNVNMEKDGIIITKEKANSKNGFSSYAKKLIVEEARPIRKINQIVRRMMRRKIHPDVISSKASVKKYEVDDDASLLPTHQDM